MKTIQVTVNNLDGICKTIDKYRGYQFIIDGNDLHDSRKKFTEKIIKLIYSFRKRQISIVINNYAKVSPFFKEVYPNLAVGYEGNARVDIIKVKDKKDVSTR